MNAVAMDAAKIFGVLKSRSRSDWLRIVLRYAPHAVTAALVLLIAHELAVLTWLITPSSAIEGPAPVVAAPAPHAATQGNLFGALANSHLFGEPPEAPVERAPVVSAPETTLNLQLSGLVAKRDPSAGQAIIAAGSNKQRKYAVGQTIEGGGGATLHAVYADRVILSRSGGLETLRLPKEHSSGAAPLRAAPLPAPPQNNSLREVISDNAAKLTSVLRIAPQLKGGKMIGFRLNPGRNHKAFESLGLKPGDVVTSINGTVLDDPSRGLQVFQSLGESTQANVTVLRNGVPTVLVIDTSQLRGLEDKRQ